MSLLRSVVENASSKGPCLRSAVPHICRSLTTVLNYLVHIIWLQNACIVIFTIILSVPSYWPLIKPAAHINLVRLYRALLSNYPTAETAVGNARIFGLLFSARIPGNNDIQSGINQASDHLKQLINEEILPLMDFMRRTGQKPLHEVVGALNRLQLESGASLSHVILGPFMVRFNELLISHLSKSRLDPNIITYFRLQLHLLVTPEGRFNSGLEAAQGNETSAILPSKRTSVVKVAAEDPSDIYRTREDHKLKAYIIGEDSLYNTIINLISAQNGSVDAMKASKIPSIDNDLYSLYQLAITLFLKKLVLNSKSSANIADSQRKIKIEDDPRRFIHAMIFESMSTASDASERDTENSLHNATPPSKHSRIDLVKRDKPHSHLLSWLQLAFVLVSEHPYFFNKSWTLKLIYDLLLLLEYNSGVTVLEVWIYRLLSALAFSTQSHRDKPLDEHDEESSLDIMENAVELMESNHDDADDGNSELSELLNCWKRVWSATTLKLGHIELISAEMALSLLERLIRFGLISRSTILASQSLLLRLPIISEYNSWDATSFLLAMVESGPLVGTGHRNECGAEVVLRWFDGALFKSYSDPVFKSESMVDPSLLSSLLVTVITGTPPINHSFSRRDSCSHILQQLASAELEVSIQQFTSARILSPHLNPYGRFQLSTLFKPRYSEDSTSYASGVSQRHSNASKFSVDHMPLSEARKNELENQLSKILSARLGQTKVDSPVQNKRRSFVLDGAKIIQLVKRQVFHGCLLISTLLKLPSQRTSFQNELATLLRDLSELIESNLKLCEGDASVASSIYREISRLALTASPQLSVPLTSSVFLDNVMENQSQPLGYLESSLLQTLFSSLLDSANSFNSSISPPSRSGSTNGAIFASQTASSSSPNQRSASTISRISLDGEDDPYMNLDFEGEGEADDVDLVATTAIPSLGHKETALSRQATELVLTPTSLSVVTLHIPISSRMQCFVQASWVQSSILAALPSGHKLLGVAAQGLLDAATTLTHNDSHSHYPLITKLIHSLALRTKELSEDQLERAMLLLTTILPTVTTAATTLLAAQELERLMESALNIINGAKLLRETSAASTSTSSLNRSLHRSGPQSSSPTRLQVSLSTLFASAIASLLKMPWRARLVLQNTMSKLLGFNPSEIGGEEIYNLIQSRLVTCLEDVDVRVRAAASQSICSLFSYFSAHRTIVADLIKGPIGSLLAMPSQLEAVSTCLKALQAISNESPLVLDSVLFTLHEACTEHIVFCSYVPIILDSQAASLGYVSRLDMLLDRLPLVFSRWTKTLQFPSFLYDEPDIITFSSHYSKLLVQGLVRPMYMAAEEHDTQHSSEKLRPLPLAQLDDLAKLSGVDCPTLMKNCYEAALATLILLQAANRNSEASEIESLIPASKSTKRTTSHLSSFDLVSCIYHLLHLVGESMEVSQLMLVESIESSFEVFSSLKADHSQPKKSKRNNMGSESLPIFSPLVLSLSLSILAAHSGFTTVSQMLGFNSHYILAHVLKSIEEWFFRTSDPTERSRAVFAVRAICTPSLEVLDSSMILACLFRFLHNSDHINLQMVILTTLRCIWSVIPLQHSEVLLKSSSFIDSLIDSISKPIASLKSSRAAHPEATKLRSEMDQLLESVLLTSSGVPKEALAVYGRFPGFLHAIFQQINDYNSEEPLASHKWHFITALSLLSPNISTIKLLSAVDQFIEGLHANHHAISSVLASRDVSPSSDDSVLSRAALAAAIRALLRISKSSDPHVQRRIAEALGAVGLFDSSLLEPSASISENAHSSLLLSMSPTAPLGSTRSEAVVVEDELEIYLPTSAAAPAASVNLDSSMDLTSTLDELSNTSLNLETLKSEIASCLSLSSNPSYSALLPLLKVLALKERSISPRVSGIARGILNKLTTTFFKTKQKAAPLIKAEGVNFFVSCWKDFSVNQRSTYPSNIAPATTPPHGWEAVFKQPSYEVWVSSLCTHLAQKSSDDVLNSCQDLISIDHEFAEVLFPLLLNDVFRLKGDEMAAFELFLERSAEKDPSRLNSRRKHFFTILSSLQAIRTASISIAKDAANNVRIVQRTAVSPPADTSSRKTRALSPSSLIPDFTFLKTRTSYHIATLARHIGLPCTALAFFEHWCETLSISSNSTSSSTFGTLRLPEDHLSTSMAYSLAQDIYSALCDTESAYALRHVEKTLSTPDSTSLSTILMQERNWSGVLNLFEVSARPSAPSAPSAPLHRNMLTALQNAGHFEIMRHYVSGLMHRSDAALDDDLSEFYFQAAWRLSDWNATWTTASMSSAASTNTATPISSHNFPFHRLAFTCLRTAMQGAQSDAKDLLDVARVQLIQSELAFFSAENRAQILPIMASLQFFTDIQHALDRMSKMAAIKKPSVAPSRASIFSSTVSSNDALSNEVYLAGVKLLEEWNQSLEAMRKATDRVELFEPLIALRGILLPHIVSSQHIHEALSSYWSSVLIASRKSKNFQMANVALENARSSLQAFQKANNQGPTFKKPPLPNSEVGTPQSRFVMLSRRFAIEECRLYWSQGKQTEAVALAKVQLKELEKSPLDLAKMLLLVGEWLGDSKIESPNVIIEQYLKKASELMRAQKEEASTRCKAYFDLGRFADHQYQLGMERMTSMEWNETMALQKKIQSEHTGIVDDRSRKTHASLFKEEITAIGRDQQEQKIKDYLNMAVSMYLYALLKGVKRDTAAVFRLITLWFSHSSEPRLASTIKNNITKVSSFKFLPLFYQIVSRISSTSAQNDFQNSLQELIVKITVDHPHPSFYQLISLANAGEAGVTHTSPSTVDKGRVAKYLISQVQARIPAIVDGMMNLAMAYTELANHKFPKDAGTLTKLPTKNLLNFKYPNIVPVATTTTMAKTSEGKFMSDSSDLVYIVGFETTCKFVGGVNLPRLIRCKGSDGKSYPQLVKGKDDLRQDAVMQQLFHTINVLLKSDSESSQSNLRIRTYNVIPLSPSAGVLEWVSNTQPVGEYLIPVPNGAHARYRPQDLVHTKCRELMDRASRATEEQRISTFQEVLKNFRPVLHHFFIENFPDPSLWYEKRLSYTRSMAVASIVGHMVGLGDRHSQNILLDKLTGEVIHIDLGIAFDQGKSLPVPELVPFRLTRDLVDALGVVGVRGVFTKSCENVVHTLREHHANLVTIAQVFLHDPLSKWLLRINANAANERTGVVDLETDESTEPLAAMKPGGLLLEEAGSRNTKAASTLLRFKQKLLGQEEGVALSVAGQVQHLITAAQDERKLALMYPGWAAWV